MSVGRALGTIAVVSDGGITRDRPKLTGVQPGTPEFDLMLATLVFDLCRKMAYIHEAARPFALQADPEITHRVMQEFRDADAFGQDYAQLAPFAHELMLRAIRRSLDDHIALMEMVERWGAPSTSEGT
jgi:hypothetical protein